jgi:ribosomal protein S18 acetylase RimI-like enzyme
MAENKLDDSFVVRQFKIDTDIIPLLHLHTDIDGKEKTEEVLRAELAWPNQDPEQDLWIVEMAYNSDVLLGYSIGFHTIPERYLVWGAVHPHWRRRGLGSTLLAHSINRGRELGADHILINTDINDEAANAFLRHKEFKARSSAWLMSAPADLSLADPVWPSGYTVCSFSEVKDYQILKEAYFGSCGDMWGHGANSQRLASTLKPIAEDWSLWFPESDPNGEGIFFVFAPDSNVAGLCRGIIGVKEAGQGEENAQSIGFIDALGVVPQCRTKQLHRPLTLTVMHWLRRQGQGAFILEVFGADEQTLKIYYELGFSLDSHLIAYHLSLL